jgi:hypothetical protein
MVDRQASAKLWAGRAGERLFVMGLVEDEFRERLSHQSEQI